MRAFLRCVDDRGRPWRFEEGTLANAIRAERLRVANPAAAMRPLRDARAMGMLALVLAMAVLIMAGAWMETRAGVHLGWAVSIAIAAGVMVLAGMAQQSIDAHAQRAAAKRLGVCPSCLHALAHVEPEADGCRVCPECGAAWHVDA